MSIKDKCIRTMPLRKDSDGVKLGSVHTHIKLTLAVDADSLMIVSVRVIPRSGPDLHHIRPVLERTVEHGASIETVVDDKGYNAETNRRFIVIELGTEAHILLRRVRSYAAQQHGLLRRRQLASFDYRLYRRRALVEAVNSMLKRESGHLPSQQARSDD